MASAKKSDLAAKRAARKQAIKDIVFFPRTVSKKYGKMIRGFKRMAQEWPDLKIKMEAYTKSYSRLVDLFIRVPIVVGLLISLWGGYTVFEASSRVSFKNWWKNDVKLKINPKQNIPKAFSRLNSRISRAGGHPTVFLLFFPIGYILGFAGSLVLSRNPIFIESDRVRDALTRFKYFDLAGKPWEFVYTPDVIMFEGYGVTPQSFKESKAFWSTINFTPTNPSSSVNNIQTFCVKKAAQLPPLIDFDKLKEFPPLEQLRGEEISSGSHKKKSKGTNEEKIQELAQKIELSEAGGSLNDVEEPEETSHIKENDVIDDEEPMDPLDGEDFDD